MSEPTPADPTVGATEISRRGVRDLRWPAAVDIFDTTLRDGSQFEGIALTADDKLKIAQLLDDLGVHYIEGGWPGANPRDDEFFVARPTVN